jgi:aminotransferase in exopolysaccharide biosynthesis
MIPLAIPYLSGNESKYLQQCVETNFVSSVGPFVDRFESMVAEAAGAKYCAATSSGTTGLHAALTAIGVKPGDLVILPSFTFIASANAIAHCGASPWLFDVSKESWSLDPELLRVVLGKETERRGEFLIHKKTNRQVKAIMPVYTLGTPADMNQISEIAKEYNLPIVADAAAALGSTYRGKNIGDFADLTVFSFNGNKTVTAGGGGGVVGNDKELVQLVHHLTTTARIGNDYTHDRIGFNYRMTNLQAAVGCAQLENLDVFVEAKRRIRNTYNSELGSIAGIGFFPSPKWAKSACWFSGIILEDQGYPEVSIFCKKMNDKGIGVRTFWKPIHLQIPFENAPKTITPVADSVWSRILTLPSSVNLSDTDQSYVISVLKELLEK